MSRAHPCCHMTLWPRGHARSRDKLKVLHLLFQKVYDHETLQGSYFWRGKITYNITWLSDQSVTPDHVTKIKTKYFLLNNAFSHQLGRMVTYNEENSPKMSYGALTTWSHEVTWQNKSKYILFCKTHGHQTLQGGDLW